MKLPTVVASCLIYAGTASASDPSAYTLTNGPMCLDRSRAHFGGWTCPGPAGYRAEFFDEGNLAGVTIRPPGTASPRPGYAWRGAGKIFGDRLEWRLVAGVPDAAILRIWRTSPEDDGAVPELVVFKVTPSGFCRIASIDAARPDANALARAEASLASRQRCEGNDPE
jgi:hypothetical protein